MPLILFVLGAVLAAQQPDTFAPAAEMTTPRAGHSATLLRNGKVLIAGGDCSEGPASTCGGLAEIYDPALDSFSPTGKMIQGRRWHSATLLADGRVLIAGGYVARDVDSAEIYDPASGLFSSTGRMTTVSRDHSAVLLSDGTVFLAGGFGAFQIYDPQSGTFSNIPAAGIASRFSRSIRLIDSRILTTAGELAQVLLFDPAARAFSAPPNTANYRNGHFSTVNLLPNGHVMIGGGNVGAYDEEGLSDLDIYDPSSNRLRRAGKMIQPRVSHTATLLPDGNLLFVGGKIGFWDGDQKTAELYNFADETVRMTAGSMGASRSYHTATLLRDGRVFIAGGNRQTATELYTPTNRVPASELLTVEGSQAAALTAGSGRLVSADYPAAPGDVLEIYLTSLSDRNKIPPLAFVGGYPAEVLYFGKVAGYATLSQINIRIPARAAKGDAVPLWISELDRPSNTVTLAIR